MAAPAAPAGTPITLAQTPQFCGEAKPGFVSAEEFLTRMDALRTGNAWTDQAAIREATRGLFGDAHRWYHHYQLIALGTAHAANMRNNWDVFVEQFKQAYFTVRSLADSDLDWLGMRQSTNQSIAAFLHNTIGAVAQSLALVKEKVSRDFAFNNLPNDDVPGAASAWLQALGAGDRAHADAILNAFGRFSRDGMLLELTRFIAAKVGARGAARDKVRNVIAKALRDGRDLPGIIETAQAEEAVAKTDGKGAPRHFGGPKPRTGHGVHGVDTADNEGPNASNQPDELHALEQELAAIWGNAQGGAESADQVAGPVAAAGGCLFCLRKGHRIRDCRQYRAHLRAQAEKRKQPRNKGKKKGDAHAIDAGEDLEMRLAQPAENF